jgi:hypothetical protein
MKRRGAVGSMRAIDYGGLCWLSRAKPCRDRCSVSPGVLGHCTFRYLVPWPKKRLGCWWGGSYRVLHMLLWTRPASITLAGASATVMQGRSSCILSTRAQTILAPRSLPHTMLLARRRRSRSLRRPCWPAEVCAARVLRRAELRIWDVRTSGSCSNRQFKQVAACSC